MAPGLPAGAIRQEMLAQLNSYRAQHGLQPVRYSKALELAADEHALDMRARRFFGHQNPDGLGPPDRAASAGFCHRLVGENLAYGRNARRAPRDALQAWIESPGHERNLRGEYAWVGMGYLHVHEGADHYYYWVQVFAR